VEPDVRDAVVDFVVHWSDRTENVSAKSILAGLNLHPGKFHEWKRRYGTSNRHNGQIPRDFWLLPEERDEIVRFYLNHQLDGYRRCAYMMIDADVVYCSPSSVYRVLADADVLRRWNRKASKKGAGFEQPKAAHEHWHIDISYVNVASTFYYLVVILDGYSRYIVHWDIRESMKESDVQLVVQRAKEKYPNAVPRVISDNGSQFTGRDFKELIRLHGMTHVTTSPYYPQSNGKLERFNKTVKGECIRPGCPLTLEDARRIVGRYVTEYNEQRLHSAIGYVTPKDKLEGNADRIHRERDRKLETARAARRAHRRLDEQWPGAGGGLSPQYRKACIHRPNKEADLTVPEKAVI
jgi:transposase InsO family protein